MIQFFSKKEGQKGFTLIELLVVIAIIGILATIVLVSLNSARQRARNAKAISDLRTFGLAMEIYYGDNNAYPTNTTMSGVAATLRSNNLLGTEFTGNDPNGAAYGWINPNTTSQYCGYYDLEGSSNYGAVKAGGNVRNDLTVAPTVVTCW